MIIPRHITPEFHRLLEEYPVVTVLGPRQAGKTTLARETLPSFRYWSLENPDHRAFALADPRGFLSAAAPPVILDEIQRAPELLSYLQGLVDQVDRAGQYVLTGSHQLELRAGIAQSLAGRTGLLNLLPLSLAELEAHAPGAPPDFTSFAHRGFLPRVHARGLRPTPAYATYYQTYVERDVRQLISLKDANLFDKFMRLLAGRAGQVVNKHSLARDTGVDGKTIDHWLSILEASFVIFRVPPYHENFGKRVIKSPKVYFVDTGLLVFLLGIQQPAQLARDPLVGGVFENLVVAEVLKTQCNRGRPPELYFYRDNHGHELDLLIPNARRFLGLEIKASATPRPDDAAGLRRFHDQVHPLHQKAVVYNGENLRHGDDARHVNLLALPRLLNQWLESPE